MSGTNNERYRSDDYYYAGIDAAMRNRRDKHENHSDENYGEPQNEEF